jgi:hypothetical protein
MAKYRVLVIGMCVKNNKIAKHGELVDDSQLNSSASELIKGGFIELVETEVELNDLEVNSKEEKPIVKKAIKKAVNK